MDDVVVEGHLLRTRTQRSATHLAATTDPQPSVSGRTLNVDCAFALYGRGRVRADVLVVYALKGTRLDFGAFCKPLGAGSSLVSNLSVFCVTHFGCQSPVLLMNLIHHCAVLTIDLAVGKCTEHHHEETESRSHRHAVLSYSGQVTSSSKSV